MGVGNNERAWKRRNLVEDEDRAATAQDGLDEEHSGPSNKSYGNAHVHGTATMWQGDMQGIQINNHYHLQRSREGRCRILLKSLTFDRMNARLYDLAVALPNTCRWLQSSRQFLA